MISEGVETDKQLSFLKQISCDEYQGYILNKPVPIDELNHRLNQALCIQENNFNPP